MTEDLLTRARELAVYIIENRATIRQAAKHFGLSKSTVHMEVTVQNVFGGQSREPEITRAGSNCFPPVFCVMLPFRQSHLPLKRPDTG